MIKFNLDYEIKCDIIAEHVMDFLENDAKVALDYFPKYYLNKIYKSFYKTIELYNNLNHNERHKFVKILCAHFMPKKSKEAKEYMESTHKVYVSNYYSALVLSGDEVGSPYDDLKYVEVFPELNAKQMKNEVFNVIFNKFNNRELLSKKRIKIDMPHGAYLFGSIEDKNDVLWVSVNFDNRTLNAGFGRKDYNIYVDFYYFIFTGDFAHDILTIEELKLKTEILCDWLNFMYPRFKNLFDDLIKAKERRM